MTCDEARALFSDLADERLGAGEREACRTHLATCAECRREWEGFERTLALLHALPRHRAPAGFANRVLAAARPEAWPKRLARRLFVPLHVKLPLEAAAVALVGVGAALMTRTPEMQWAMREATPPAYQAPASGVAPTPEPRSSTPTAASSSEPKTEPPVVPKTKPPAVSSEAEKSARQDAPPRQAATPPPESPAPRALEKAQEAARARGPAVSRLAAPGPAVIGRLAVDERAEAERALAALFARVGASEVSRVEVTDGVVVEADVQRAQYAELVNGLAAIGAWAADGEPEADADRVRVRVRMVRRPAG
ncbi:MAG: zf-HC2 domain-containing protein [Candidatus Rokuibacteriota bacterium]